MRGLTVGVLLTCLLGASGGAALAQEPSPEPSAAGPSLAFGLLDEPWSFMYLAFPDGWRPLAEGVPGRGHIVYNLWADEWCEADIKTGGDLVRSAEAWAAGFVSYFADSTEFVDISRSVVDLPAGEAQRLEHRSTGDDEDWTQYLLSDGEALYHLKCAGRTRPADGWLSIVKSLTIGPDVRSQFQDFRELVEAGGDVEDWAAEMPLSSDFDPRVAMPMFGFAVEFPEEWVVEPVGITEDQTKDDPFMEFIFARTVDAVCSIWDYTPVAEVGGWATVEEMAADRPAWGIELLDLPAGTAGREEGRLDDGSVRATYRFTDGRRWLDMSCHVTRDVPPDDRWLSIAETFEWLPAEE